MHVLPVHADVGAGHEGRLVTRQIRDESRNLLGLAQPAHRDLGEDLRVQHLASGIAMTIWGPIYSPGRWR
jgi:hypothetical protein